MAKKSQGPSWYDLLGVSPDASPEQIKAAWRNATDAFEPGTGASQFRLFNEAADVLLDPAKRAEYDAERAGASAEPPPPAPTKPKKAKRPPVVENPDLEPVETDLEPTPRSVKIVAVLAVLATASLVLAAILGIMLQSKVGSRQDQAATGVEAAAVAERALTAVLSYDYRHMDADRDRATKFMTAKFRKDFVETFTLLTEGPDGQPGGAVKTKAVVTADVLGSGVVEADDDEVRVLVFVNQSSVKGTGTPSIFQNRVVATMVQRDGSWLVDDVKSY